MPLKNLSQPLFFPHETIRPIQNEMIALISKELEHKQLVVIHAPTGLGKTSASLAPALSYAIMHNKKILFLTSRNTQHKLAMETIRLIKQKFSIPLTAIDIVGKKWMCIQPGVHSLSSGEFSEYCKAMREDKQCAYYEKLKSGEKISPQTLFALKELTTIGAVDYETIVDVGAQQEVCPYELAMMLARQAGIIVADYYYVFHPHVRESFLQKNEIALSDCIVIVDEAHNLPDRIKNLASEQLSTNMLKRAITEAKKINHSDLSSIFEKIFIKMSNLLSDDKEEEYISKDLVKDMITNICDYQELTKECHKVGKIIREEQKQSMIGTIATFLDAWLGEDDGFTRIIHKKKRSLQESIHISYRCLDPSIISKPVFSQTHSSIIMSGTLTPTQMYAELLGFPQSISQEEFPSPFPPENRLNLIVAKTSTKFTSRSDQQFKDIADVITKIANATPGNSAVFFPSYYFKEKVNAYLEDVTKTVFNELQELTTLQKQELIDKFRSYKETGALLLAVGAGSFGEGIDLPGDELKTVVIVGLPLSKPDLETNALIEYYDKKFKKGWDYGYLFPAFNKIIQNAGRCIRSAQDKGVIVFLDERFTWNNYYRCFPSTWKMKVNINYYEDEIKKFFNKE